MVTARKLAANRLNAARSTGPRTRPGKAKSKYNAVSHGLRSLSPVLPGEDPAEWERFLADVVRGLAPAGPLEAELAARIASLQWRLRRVPLCEVAAATHPPAADPDAPPRFGFADRTELPKLRKDLAFTELMLVRWRRLRVLLAGLSAAADGDRMTGGDAPNLLEGAGLAVPPPPGEWVARPRVSARVPEPDHVIEKWTCG